MQYLKNAEFEALMAAIHRCNQLGLPLVLIAAGLPKIAKIAGDIKSYAERLFKFIPVDKLQEDDAKQALIQPAKKLLINLFLDKVVVTDKQIDIKLTTDAISNMLTKQRLIYSGSCRTYYKHNSSCFFLTTSRPLIFNETITPLQPQQLYSERQFHISQYPSRPEHAAQYHIFVPLSDLVLSAQAV